MRWWWTLEIREMETQRMFLENRRHVDYLMFDPESWTISVRGLPDSPKRCPIDAYGGPRSHALPPIRDDLARTVIAGRWIFWGTASVHSIADALTMRGRGMRRRGEGGGDGEGFVGRLRCFEGGFGFSESEDDEKRTRKSGGVEEEEERGEGGRVFDWRVYGYAVECG
ncbi:hypothetical protein BC829DRAFT_405362 [Chytridium lagenaria]|nr:hypothetical protein BC829DRAFT_405362 [Chytridium lagenaria]